MVAALILLLLQSAAPGAQAPTRANDSITVTGVVHDSVGGLVPGAAVILRPSNGLDRQMTTGSDGKFTLTATGSGELILIVRAGGFAEKRQPIVRGGSNDNIDIVLVPASVFEAITVTPSRTEQRLGDVPASVTVIGRDEIRRSPAVAADDVLRQVPTFSLFRRTSSLVAHPTTQGVSLRGVGPSGVSRTLVLLDGIPVNDPFGGWVYWTRIPLERTNRIELVDGSSSSLYGNYALGGVINVVTTPPMPKTLDVRMQYGNLNSPKFDVSASNVWGKVGVAADVSFFDTDGYAPVVAVNPAGVPERGLVDNNATANFKNFGVRMDYDPTNRLHAFVRVGYFREDRDNGKKSTVDGTEEANDTTWTAVSTGARYRLANAGELQANVFMDFETFHSNFLAVPVATPPRSVGRMTLNQTVPTNGVGGLVQWSRTYAAKHNVSAGFDWRWVDGDSQEDGLDASTGTQVTLKRVSGGTQRSVGAFVQDVMTPIAPLTITLSGRFDHWRNYDAHNLETNYPSGTPTPNNNPSLPGKDDAVFSPRMAALYRVNSRVNVWGDLGWGFRAPTLNELYRQFRVGNTLTLPNNQLGPERLVGGEAGVSAALASNLTWRATWFDNRITDPVSNVTLSTGATITQQRQNLGKTRVSGLQTDVEYRIGTMWRFGGGYLYDRARVTEFAANPALVGNYLPQVPKHRGTVQVSYTNPKFATISFEVLAIGTQFDDDQNLRAVPGYTTPGLPKYGTVSLRASRTLGSRVEVFFGVQNLFDQEYFVMTNPTTVGSPRLISGGVRVRVGQ